MGQIARFPGRCSKCDRKIIRDRDLIEKNTYGQWVHVDCPNWNRSQVSKNNSPPKTTEIKNEEDHFHGFHLKSESRGSAILDDLDYEKTDFIKMSHDYHENHNDYDYVLCKVPIQHQLLNCKTNRPASINPVSYTHLTLPTSDLV